MIAMVNVVVVGMMICGDTVIRIMIHRIGTVGVVAAAVRMILTAGSIDIIIVVIIIMMQ
jgi:hypothetical protein